MLGQRDELVRRDVAPQRVVPAQQRLDAGHLAAVRVGLRLVVQLEGALLDGAGQVADQRQPPRAVRVAVGRVARDPGEAVLGVVHRHLGPAQQQRCRRAVAWRRRRCRCWRPHVEVDLAEVERPGDVAGDALRPCLRCARRRRRAGRRTRRHRAAPRRSPRARAWRQPLADLAEQLVADVVAEGVVDLLEAVDVHQQHGGRAGRTAAGARAAAGSAAGWAARSAGRAVTGARSPAAAARTRSTSPEFVSATLAWPASASNSLGPRGRTC